MTQYTAENFSTALGCAASDWKRQSNALNAFFVFSNFNAPFDFMTQAAVVAERLQHHPD